MTEPIREIADWRNALRPWADRLAELVTDIDNVCRSLSDADLAILLEQGQQANQTNCYWAVYDVARFVVAQARREKYRRQQIGEAP